MFDNIGRKIKSLASIVCWLGIISFAIWGILIISAGRRIGLGGTLLGIIVIVGGGVISWMGSLTTYGLGELIETNQEISKNMREIKHKMEQPAATTSIAAKPKTEETALSHRPMEITPAPATQEKSDSPVVPIPDAESEGQYCICPVCNQKQRVGRALCFKCGQKFVE